MGWAGVVRRGLYRLESWLDRNLYRLRRRFGWLGELSVHPYRELGTVAKLTIHGRVLCAAQKRRGRLEDPWWRNLWAVLRALASDELPGAALRARFNGESAEGVTDEEGYFHLELQGDGGGGWREVEIELLSPGPAKAVCQALVPPDDSEFGVISDLDDTVIVTEVPRPFKMLRLLLFRNAYSRRAFDGAAGLYQALAAGSDGRRRNPVFYVSSGSWNFYDLLEEFLEHNGFPRGPILLRDIGLEKDRFLAEGHEHKLRKIERILSTYPKLPFVLIGDSSQDDPDLYAEALRRHPGRLRAIYIRDVSHAKREAVSALAARVNDQGVIMRMFTSSSEAHAWAREAGWIV